jgi:type IV secretory pathway VirB4 component
MEVKTRKEMRQDKKLKAATEKAAKQNEKALSKKQGVKTKTRIPRTVQESIPYTAVYKNGIIETRPGTYTKSYLLNDVNFKIATEDEQINIFTAFEDLLNSFPAEVHLEITINNRNVDREQFYRNVLLAEKNDELDEYREEYNTMLKDKLDEGHNNLVREKYLTLSVEADGIESATASFARLDTEVSSAVKKIGGLEVEPMSITERLSVLHDIYNMGADRPPFYKEENINGKEVKIFDLKDLTRRGMTSKDLIAPSYMRFEPTYFMVGDKFAQTVFLDNLPAYLSPDTLTDIAENPCNMITSVHYEAYRQDKAMKLIRNQIVNINSNVMEAQKKATRAGYSVELISPDLQKAQQDAQELLQDMTQRNQKLFNVTIVITHFADSKEELDKQRDMITTAVSRHICAIKKLPYQQENAFNTSLPLGLNNLEVKRMLTTESAAVFMPYSVQELSQNHGMYYGLNAVSRNMILFSRKNSKNANGVILGTPGSGKSFSAKREIVNVLLNTDDYVYIIDPEREYTALANLLGGSVVHISPGGSNHINPLDMDIDYADDDNDPISLMSSFICSICETVLGGHYGLSPSQKTIIDRCVRQVYAPYMDYMKKRTDGVTFDREAMPTLTDLYNILQNQPEPDAYNIALALELYTKGTLNTFVSWSMISKIWELE